MEKLNSKIGSSLKSNRPISLKQRSFMNIKKYLKMLGNDVVAASRAPFNFLLSSILS